MLIWLLIANQPKKTPTNITEVCGCSSSKTRLDAVGQFQQLAAVNHRMIASSFQKWTYFGPSFSPTRCKILAGQLPGKYGHHDGLIRSYEKNMEFMQDLTLVHWPSQSVLISRVENPQLTDSKRWLLP